MPTCGTLPFSILTLFFIGLLIGVIIILFSHLRGMSFKRKYGFKDSEMIEMDRINPAGGDVLHGKPKETVDGATALRDFNKK